MGLFSRRAAPIDGNTTNATATPREKGNFRNRVMNGNSNSKTTRHHRGETWNTRPSFGQWLKATWLDLLTMVIMGAIGLGVYEAHPAPTRSFPLLFSDGEVVYPEFAYPLRHEIIPIWEAALLGSLVPIAVILLMQIRIRSFWDVNNAVIGLLYSLITAAVFQVFLKWLIGGLRPHFYDVCKPLIQPGTAPSGNGFQSIMYDRSICTGDTDQIDDSLESFPSGHSTAAFAGFIYLYLYLNAKLKLWSNHHPAFWKLIVTYAPVLGAVLIAGSLTIDEFHNWYDVLAGGIIGSVMAFSAYRMVYAAIWDFRFNHIPLTRHTPFMYGAGQMGLDGFHDVTWTRKAGWGADEGNGAFGGAPGDAADGMRGTPFGAATGVAGGAGNGVGHGAGNGITNTNGYHRQSDGVGNTKGHHYQSDGVGYSNGHHRQSNSIGRKPVASDGAEVV